MKKVFGRCSSNKLSQKRNSVNLPSAEPATDIPVDAGKHQLQKLEPPLARLSFSISLFKLMTKDADLSEIAGMQIHN